MTIDVSGNEEPLRRRGKANIKEQVGILRRAAAQNAEVLVIECAGITANIKAVTASHLQAMLRRDYECAARSCRCDGGQPSGNCGYVEQHDSQRRRFIYGR